MRPLVRLVRVLPARRVPLRTGLGLALAALRHRLRPRPAYAIRLGRGHVLLSDANYAIDRKTLDFVIRDHAWDADYAGAVVLDVGAHKGYVAAYALAQGARAVISYEPERANLELLERTAASFRARGADWTVRPTAVSAERGEAELHVMSASWGHALRPPATFAEYEVGTQRVVVEALADVVAEGSARAAGAPVVLKLNIEGAECEAVLGTPGDALVGVSEVLVETHPWASCDADRLAAHLAPAGLTRIESPHRVVLRLRRAGSPGSDPRTVPS